MENRRKSRFNYYHHRNRNEVLTDSLTRNLYQLIIRQMHHDGYIATASSVSQATGTIVPDVEHDGTRLRRIVENGLAVERARIKRRRNFEAVSVVERHIDSSKVYMPLEISDAETRNKSVQMELVFTTSALPGAPRDISFSPDGKLVSCAGAKGVSMILSTESIDNLSTDENLHYSQKDELIRRNENEITDLSTARQYYDHGQYNVEVMRFHPTACRVFTGGADGYVVLRDYSSTDNQKELLKIRDVAPVRCGCFHPSGDYILYGTDQTSPRLLNLATGAIMTTSRGQRGDGFTVYAHTAALTDVAFSPDGRTFASTSFDGSWTVYDGATGKSIYRHENGHSSVAVTSAVYSRTGNILLTAGMDSVARLWDLRYLDGFSSLSSTTGEALSVGEPKKADHRSISAVFSFDESHVLIQDPSLKAVHSYCVYTCDLTSTLTTTPAFSQHCIATTGTSPLVITGADDLRLRLWAPTWRA